MTKVASPEGTVHYEYHEFGELARTYTGASSAAAVSDTRYYYDLWGRLGQVTVVERNDAGPLSFNQQETTQYQYDAVGNLDLVIWSKGQVTLSPGQTTPNRLTTDYEYDALNRLARMKEYGPEAPGGDTNYLNNPVLADYDYRLRVDGRRAGVTEVDRAGQQTTVDWFYDALGRLTKEVYNGPGTALDFTDEYVHDLVGNRRQKRHDAGSDAAVDEAVASLYDAHDRLLSEAKDVAGGTANDRFTRYEYGPGATATPLFGGNGTQQTKKTVWAGLSDAGAVQETTTYGYNVQGRMTSSSVAQGGTTTTNTYAYNDSGIRTKQTEQIGAGATTATLYLVDEQNPTGYAQVLEEKTGAAPTAATLPTRSYTLGLDVVSQTTAASCTTATAAPASWSTARARF